MKRESTTIFTILCVLFTNLDANAVTVTLDPLVEHHVFEGWGTSICWWGNIISQYPQQTRDSIMDLLFDTTDGLGLSIVRYNIGGGDNPSHTHMGVGKMMEGFKANESAPYDWSRDAGQRWVVAAAKERIPSEWFIAEAFSNSPPHWMTVSGCASGGSGGSNNLKSDYYAQFADYLTSVVKHFNDEWGVFFRTLEPMNEPDIAWTVNGGQEGCSFSHENQAKLIRVVKNKIDEKQLATKIAAPDGSSYGATITAYNSYDDTVKSYVYQINTHGYFGGSRTDLQTASRRDGKRLWASEIDGSGAEYPFDQWTHNHNDIVPALDIANRIIRDLRDLKAHGWVFWQIIESEQAQTSLNKNWGCIHADFNGGNRYHITKKYYALLQFSNFIRPFSRMISINNNDAVAFLSPEQDQLIIVQRNASNAAVSYDYRLSNFLHIGPTASVWRSSATENFKKVNDLSVVNGTLSASSPAQSITTYILPVQQHDIAGNLVLNGDFSSGSDNWMFNVWSGSGTGGVINEEYIIHTSSTALRSHDIQLIQSGLFLENGKTYKIAFDAYASANRSLEVNVQMSSDPWNSYLPELQRFDLSTTKNAYYFTFAMNQTTDANGQISFNVGASGETVTIDNVSVEAIDPTTAFIHSKTSAQSIVNTRCSNSILHVTFTAPANSTSLKLYDLKGKQLKTIALKTRYGEICSSSLDITPLPNGHYIVKIYSGKSILQTTKVLVSK